MDETGDYPRAYVAALEEFVAAYSAVHDRGKYARPPSPAEHERADTARDWLAKNLNWRRSVPELFRRAGFMEATA